MDHKMYFYDPVTSKGILTTFCPLKQSSGPHNRGTALQMWICSHLCQPEI